MKRFIEWGTNSSDVLAQRVGSTTTVGNFFVAGSIAVVASVFLPIPAAAGIFVMAAPVLGFGLARAVNLSFRSLHRSLGNR